MGCGCGKKNNAIRGSKNTNQNNSSKNASSSKEERRKSLKLIRINATKAAAPRKQK